MACLFVAAAAALLAAPANGRRDGSTAQLLQSLGETRSLELSPGDGIHSRDLCLVPVRGGPYGARAALGDFAGLSARRELRAAAAPGLPLAALPLHLGARTVLERLGVEHLLRLRIQEVFVVWAFVAAPLGVVAFAIARTLRALGLAGEDDAARTAILVTVGTALLPWATVFRPVVLATGLLSVSLALAAGPAPGLVRLAGAGLAAGLAVLCDRLALLPAAGCLGVAAARAGLAGALAFGVAALPGLAVLAAWQRAVLGGATVDPGTVHTFSWLRTPTLVVPDALSAAETLLGVPTPRRGWLVAQPLALVFARGLWTLARAPGPARPVAAIGLAVAGLTLGVELFLHRELQDPTPTAPASAVYVLPFLALGAPAGIAALSPRLRRWAVLAGVAIALVAAQGRWVFSLAGCVEDLVAAGPRAPGLATVLLGHGPDDASLAADGLGLVALGAAIGLALRAAGAALPRRVRFLVLLSPVLLALPHVVLFPGNELQQQRAASIRDVRRAIRSARTPAQARNAWTRALAQDEPPLIAASLERVAAVDPADTGAAELARAIRVAFEQVDGNRRSDARARESREAWAVIGAERPR